MTSGGRIRHFARTSYFRLFWMSYIPDGAEIIEVLDSDSDNTVNETSTETSVPWSGAVTQEFLEQGLQ